MQRRATDLAALATECGGRVALACVAEEVGVADGTRTHDNRNHNPGLYQLSYSHRCSRTRSARLEYLACPTGLEPITPSLEGWCSIRLSYGQGDRMSRSAGMLVGVRGFEPPTSCS